MIPAQHKVDILPEHVVFDAAAPFDNPVVKQVDGNLVFEEGGVVVHPVGGSLHRPAEFLEVVINAVKAGNGDDAVHHQEHRQKGNGLHQQDDEDQQAAERLEEGHELVDAHPAPGFDLGIKRVILPEILFGHAVLEG